MEKYAGLIIALAVILVIAICILAVIIKIKRSVESFSRSAFGTSSLSEGLKQQKIDLSETPRSLQAMTRIFLPQIQKDFPEFNYGEFARQAETLIKTYLSALTTKNVASLAKYPAVMKAAQNEIEDLKKQNAEESFTNVSVHKTEIADYVKKSGTCIVKFVTSIEYIYCKYDDSGELIDGDSSIKKQTVYETELMYIQDISKIESKEFDKSLGLNCPNCGAPIKNIGAKFCEYCHTGIKEVNIYSWSFCSVKEQGDKF